MGKSIFTVILCFWVSSLLYSQAVSLMPAPSRDTTALKTPAAKAEPEKKDREEPMGSSVLKPIIGFGAGMLSFSGEINSKSFMQNPSVSRIGYDFTVSQKLNSFLQFNFYALYGKLGVAQDENAPARNANFESQIFLGGINLQYNFDQLLPKNRNIEPFILSGIESFSFDSKTDLYDKNGNKYYYWTDGSVKNMPQNSPNAANAVTLVRNYTYETDLRQLDQYGFGKYSMNSFAIPVGIGANFHLSERVDLNIATTMHFTLTDYIDGLGGRKDKFMMTGFSLHWDLLGPKRPIDTLDVHWFDNVDFAALESADSDGDGVRDTADLCPGTPPGASVNAQGCPTDGDGDGVPDYADKELNSKPNAVVDANGVTLSDSIVRQRYRQFSDTANQNAEIIAKFHGPYDLNGEGQIIHNTPAMAKTANGEFIPQEYLILIGVFKSGLPNTTMTKFLSIRDVETTPLPDSSIAYTVGHYTNFADAQSRKRTSVKEGMKDAKIVYKKDGQFVEATSDIIAELSEKDKKTQALTKGATKLNKGSNKYAPEGIDKDDSLLVANTKGVVFRIQLGAYKQRISKAVFGNVPDLIEIRTKDGLYKYMTGSYASFNDAAKNKVDLSSTYPRAFIAAYKDGKRVALSSVGATPAAGKKSIKENINAPEKPANSINKKSLVFKVQIGVYKNEPPADEQAKYKTLKETVQQESTSTGLIRFTVGNTNDYKEAMSLKNKMKQRGLGDAFVIAFYNGQYITIQEALELSK